MNISFDTSLFPGHSYSPLNKQKDTKMDNPEEIIEKDYEALDSTPSLDKRLTLSEEDAIRAQFMQCWSIPLGIPYDDTMIVKIKIYLNTDGPYSKPQRLFNTKG